MKLTLANQYFMINDKKLAFYQSAPIQEQKKTIVLLHGFCGSSAYYYKLIPILEANYQIIAFDLPGHGESDSLDDSTYDLAAVAALLQQAIRKLALQQVHMFGHSLGGYLTLAYAQQFPDELDSFGLLHSTALPDSEQAKQNRLNAIATVEKSGVEAFAPGLVSKLFAADANQQDVELATSIAFITKAEAVIGFARGMYERPDRQHIIKAANQPVLLVSGALDQIVTAEGTFSGRNDKTVCEIVERAGHMGMLEAPEELAKIIKAFVA